MHGDDGTREGEGCDDAADYEKGFEAECADVGDEGHRRVDLARVAGGSFGEPVYEEGEEGEGPDGAAG